MRTDDEKTVGRDLQSLPQNSEFVIRQLPLWPRSPRFRNRGERGQRFYH
jgi:hypothetical protein